MLYCYDRGKTSCCFVQEECGGEWKEINNDMRTKAIDFIIEPQKKLDNLVESAGYDTCHRIKDYDVDQCHQDCIKQEQGDFAKECRKNDGVYKCCIR